ncbi:unnamed protein product, partial [Vitis vinifera]|uniref:Uncharacterized protein n=1 Tax=Vitis vinifera TaxID=29760 RepID=D7T184_VITVI
MTFSQKKSFNKYGLMVFLPPLEKIGLDHRVGQGK